MESSTETSSGTESFDGVEEDDSDYSGSGGFTGNSFDSTTYTDHDGSDTTTDAAGKLNGTESQNDYELHTWNETRQDVDSVSAPGDDESDTDTDQDYGTTTKQVNILTSYTEGTPTEQGGTTIQKDDTNSFTEEDPEDVVTNNNPTNFIPAADGGSGAAGSPTRAQFVAGQPAGSTGTTTTTGTGTPGGGSAEKGNWCADDEAESAQEQITLASGIEQPSTDYRDRYLGRHWGRDRPIRQADRSQRDSKCSGYDSRFTQCDYDWPRCFTSS